MPWAPALAQSVVVAQNGAPAAEATPATNAVTTQFDKAINTNENWYFSWGYSRQQYAPSDIRVSQPELGSPTAHREAETAKAHRG